jgi:hypothetical protein
VTGHRYRWRHERDLQDGLHLVLTEAGFTVDREVEVASGCRVDLVVDNVVGVEVKVRSSVEDVARQLQRYAHSCGISALVLATTQARHRELPAVIAGMPLFVAYLTHVA